MKTRDRFRRAFGKFKVGLVVRTRYLLLIDILSILLASGISRIILDESFHTILSHYHTYWLMLGCFVLIRLCVNGGFNLYSRIWKYASTHEVLQIIKSSLLSFSLIFLLGIYVFPFLGISAVSSVSYYFLDGLVFLAFLSGSRFGLRIFMNWLNTHRQRFSGSAALRRNVLVLGVGDCGSFITRLMLDHPEQGIVPVGFIDDDPDKQSLRIYSIPVLGKRQDIFQIVTKYDIKEVIVALPDLSQNEIESIHQICGNAGIGMRVMPEMCNLASGDLSLRDVRLWRPAESSLRSSVEIGEETKYQNILVTGGAGFIGSNFVRFMLSEYPNSRIIVYDKLTYAGNLDNLHGLKNRYDKQYIFIHGDITDYKQVSSVMADYQIDAIINFAAETHVDRSLLTPEQFLKTNYFGTYYLLEAARAFNVKRFHQVSTDEVYGQVLNGSFFEEDPVEARSPYSASKAAADLLVQSYFVSYGVRTTITRSSNNIGPYQYLEKVVPLFITSALDNKPLPVYGDGLYVRDYLYTRDHCRGIACVLKQGSPGEIYNLGSGNEVEAIVLAQMILNYLKKPQSLIRYVRDRQGQDRRYSLNCSKIKALGWAPQWSFEKALYTTIDWYIKNEWWWRKISSGEYKDFYETQYRDRLNQSSRPVVTE